MNADELDQLVADARRANDGLIDAAIAWDAGRHPAWARRLSNRRSTKPTNLGRWGRQGVGE